MTATAVNAGRAARLEARRDRRRRDILEAARACFVEAGLEGTTVRGIARRAGYAPGALYQYYRGREEIYADLLGGSLAGLGDAIRRAGAGPGGARGPGAPLRRTLGAFFDWYAARPEELDLGLYLFGGAGRRGLTPDLDRRLNGRLIGALAQMADALRTATGCEGAVAEREIASLVSHMVGCLVMKRAGRLDVLGQDAADLVGRRIDELLERLAGESAL